MAAAAEKRLARLVGKLLQYPQVLQEDGAGGFIGKVDHKPAIRLSQKNAKYALSRGILEPGGGSGLIASDAAEKWVKRTLGDDVAHGGLDNIFGAQHWQVQEREVFDCDGDLVLVQVNVETSPLLRLYRQTDAQGTRFLSVAEFAAGEKLRQDYAGSTMGNMSASNWGAVRQGRSAARAAYCADDRHVRSLDGRRRVMDALAAVGPVLDRVLFSLLLREQDLQTMEQNCHWPKRSGKIVLKIALARLAHFYRLA